MRRAQSSTLSSTHGHTQGEMGSLQEMWGRVETVWGRVPCHISCPREYIEGGPLRLRPGPSAPRHPGAACGLGTRLGAASAFPMLGWWGVGAVVLRVDRPGTAQSRCKANWTPERAQNYARPRVARIVSAKPSFGLRNSPRSIEPLPSVSKMGQIACTVLRISAT